MFFDGIKLPSQIYRADNLNAPKYSELLYPTLRCESGIIHY